MLNSAGFGARVAAALALAALPAAAAASSPRVVASPQQGPLTVVCQFPETPLAAGEVNAQTNTYVLTDGSWTASANTFQKREAIRASGSGAPLNVTTTVDRVSGIATLEISAPELGDRGLLGRVQGQCHKAEGQQF